MTLRKKHKSDLNTKIKFKEQSATNTDDPVKTHKPSQFENEPEILSASSRRFLTKHNDMLRKQIEVPSNQQDNAKKKAIDIKPAVLLEFDNSKFRLNCVKNNESEISVKDGEVLVDPTTEKTNSLFHPSRIAMSSTPVHTNPSESLFFFNFVFDMIE
jgi:hypothetical protein